MLSALGVTDGAPTPENCIQIEMLILGRAHGLDEVPCHCAQASTSAGSLGSSPTPQGKRKHAKAGEDPMGRGGRGKQRLPSCRVSKSEPETKSKKARCF